MVMMLACSFASKQVIPTDTPPTHILTEIPIPAPITSPTPTPIPQAPIVVPRYIVPIEILNEAGELVGAANAFLVNREKGQFATNAHVVGGGVKFKIILNSISYRVGVVGINWWADVGIVKLLDNDIEALSLPEAVSFAETPRVQDILSMRGYVFEKGETGELSVIPYLLDVGVSDNHSDWAITLQDYAERALFSDLLLRQSIRDGTAPEVPNALKHRYYEDYILLAWLESPNSIAGFKNGMSGTPVYTDKGRVVAMISNISGEDLGLAIPAGEIIALLEEVNGSAGRSR